MRAVIENVVTKLPKLSVKGQKVKLRKLTRNIEALE